MGEGAGQKRAGGPVVVLGHEGGTRAEGSEVERVDKMWWTPDTLDVGAWCQRACEQRTVHWFHRLKNSLVWTRRGGRRGGGGEGNLTAGLVWPVTGGCEGMHQLV